MTNPTPRDSAQLPLTDAQILRGIAALQQCSESEAESLSATLFDIYAGEVRRVHEALRAQAASVEPVLEVVSWTNGSYHRNYKLNWLKDVEAGTKLYAGAPPAHIPADVEALTIATEALEEIALAGMSGTGQESDEAMTEWHARQAWKFIGIAARAKSAIAARAGQVAAPAMVPLTDERINEFVDRANSGNLGIAELRELTREIEAEIAKLNGLTVGGKASEVVKVPPFDIRKD